MSVEPVDMADRGEWIQTASGRRWYLEDPRPQEVHVPDVARALANLCRFTGHTIGFYSVAEHCVHCSLIVRGRAAQLAALVHDAPEAYLGDVATPLKNLLGEYRRLEARTWAAMAGRFGVPVVLPESVKRADQVMLATERRDLLLADAAGCEWPCLRGVTPLKGMLQPMAPELARAHWVSRFEELTGEDVDA